MSGQKVADYPSAIRQRAERSRSAVVRYFAAKTAGFSEREAIHLARARWLEEFEILPSAQTIRRWVKKAYNHGGARASINFYLEECSR